MIAILIAAIALAIVWYATTLPVHYDGLHPLASVRTDHVARSDVLFAMPVYGDDKLTDHPDWAEWLKDTDRPIGLYAPVSFAEPVPQADIDDMIETFADAFGFPPTEFKAPGYAVHADNRPRLAMRGIATIHTWHPLRKVYVAAI